MCVQGTHLHQSHQLLCFQQLCWLGPGGSEWHSDQPIESSYPMFSTVRKDK